MFDDFYHSSITTILRQYIESIKQRLFDDERINKMKDRIHSEAWANDNGVALGAISYLSNPSDEAISFTIDVQQ